LPVCLQNSIPPAKPELAPPSLIGLILKDLQGLYLPSPVHGHFLGRQIALSSVYFLHTNSKAKEKSPAPTNVRLSSLFDSVCPNVKIHALISILKFEAGSKSSTKQRLTVNHATLHPKSIRGLNFYRSARLQLGQRHNAGAVCAYVFRESTFGQT